MAGSITAALFLKRFVTNAKSWAHFDIFGWAPSERPHSPVGGEAQAIRALYQHVAEDDEVTSQPGVTWQTETLAVTILPAIAGGSVIYA